MRSGWPSVDATVTKTSLSTLKLYNKLEKRDFRHFWLTIAVRYTVDGKDFTSRETSMYDDDQSGLVDSLKRDYAEGTHHRIFYKPDQPEVVVLDQPSGFNFWIPAIFGAFTQIVPALFYSQIFTVLGYWLIRRSR